MTAASGSAGDVVASHNSAGRYTRNRTVPLDPRTIIQVVMRDAMTSLATTWRVTLTEAQRAAWAVYAANVTLPNRIGRQRHVSAYNMFVRSNIARIQASRIIRTIAPPLFSLSSFARITNVRGHRLPRTLTFQFDDAAAWCTERGSFIGVYASRSRPLTINFWRGPYEFLGTWPALPSGIPTSPATLTLIKQPIVGERTFVRMFVSRIDGRLSNTQFSHGPNVLF